ncbi:DgyrCDS13422 [Dimorphilus gyrociliatus]|uniref:Elongation of very long chain fatty acids protein n=1 Tax=Dimorphilus gyrociliatus TaxID=2664684 RepID=A0A7I8WAM3_9ANNE|nr:DgyrCDS13422 [Dimorphilus gyrociliatus]
MYSQVYDFFQREVLPYGDPRSKDWFLLQSNPVPVWIITIAYLLFVTLGQKFMKNRPAYDLKWFMIIYNLGLVVWSLYMVIEIPIATWKADYNFICAELNDERRKDPRELRVAAVMWWYFFSKAIELLDTVLMVLRKKNNQITFLHVFHHASMLNIWWWVGMFIPSGLSFFGSWLNSLVHVFMYAYYGLTAIPAARPYLWWKKYITKLQLIPILLQKEIEYDERGNALLDEDNKPKLRCGFRIGGGIDQDNTLSAQGYPDKGVYVTYIYENGPGHKAGLQQHDKILQVNGHDMTVVTHKKAVEYIKRKAILNMLVYRKGVPQIPSSQQAPVYNPPQFSSPQRQPPMPHSPMHRPDHNFGRNSPMHSPSRHYQPASPGHHSGFDRSSFDAMQAKPY